MSDNKKELEELLKGFEDELVAAVSREEAMREHISALEKENRRLAEQLGSIRIRSWVRKKIDDPKSKIGKMMRLPRTAYRVIRYSEVRRDISRKSRGEDYAERSESEVMAPANETKKLAFSPIDFFVSSSDVKRVNLVVRKLEKSLLKQAIEFANCNDYELRVVAYGESVEPVEYRKWVKKSEVPEAKKISFYSSVDQAEKEIPFKLEIGKNDIFLTNTWRVDEE